MKAATSIDRFDEARRFTAVGEQMGRVRLDSDANEASAIWRTEHLRRSADLAEGSPDDGFRPMTTYLLDPIATTEGWSVTGLAAGDQRVIRTELGLTRRDPETLPRVVRVRGATRVQRTLPAAIDLLHLPVPLASDAGSPNAATYVARGLVLPVRFVRERTDDEVVNPRVLLLDGAGGEHLVDVGLHPGPDEARGQSGSGWVEVRIDALGALPRTALPGGGQAALLLGWGLVDLPPRAEVYLDALEADPALAETDVVLRGGDGTLAGAGRLYASGRRSFIERDWRYSTQPDLPGPAPLTRPNPRLLADGSLWFGSHAIYADISEVVVHGFQDQFIREPALDGEDTTFRTRQVTQVRVLAEEPDALGRPPRDVALPTPTSDARLTTNVAAGALPDRVPPDRPDPCRDRCLTTENATTGEGYTGSRHLNVRLEVLAVTGDGAVVGWARDNAATVVPLRLDAPAGAARLLLDPAHAARFTAGDLVVVEDRLSRLDPGSPAHATALRRLRAVDTAEGVLELEPAGHTLTNDPRPLPAGGPLPRAFTTDDAAAVRRWDGADWLVTGVRYALPDGVTFAFSGGPARVGEYWTFTARVVAADGASVGVVEQLTGAPVRGPVHVRVPLGRVVWTATGRELVDLRRQFLPLHDVRDRLIELGRRQISPGGFTVVVGDGRETFGDIDQNLAEGVTGDEAIQAAVDRLGAAGGTVYIRKGEYVLEHPVLVQARNNVRVLGDGDATALTVTGAGGAFYLDWCGHSGAVSIELMRLIEAPAESTPFGLDLLGGGGGAGVPVPAGLVGAVPLTRADLIAEAPTAPDLLAAIAERLRILPAVEGRAAASVVGTIRELRRLQRLHPGRPLEDSAPDQLAVLRALPHGVVTVADSRQVTLDRLRVESRGRRPETPLHAGVLLAGTLTGVAVARCRVTAPAGVVAAPYGRYLLPASLVVRPRAGLAVRGLTLTENDLGPVSAGAGVGQAAHGLRIADGVIEGLVVEGNRVQGFETGIVIEDQAEEREGEPVDRTLLRRNYVLATRAGIAVTGDGVDVAGNEVRLGPATAGPAGTGTRAGVGVAGTGCRVRDNWVSLPAPAARPELGFDVGVQVGSGIDDGRLAARPVHDVEVAANRVEGAGDASAAIGVLVGGTQPIVQVQVSENTLRSLGGAGVRAWGHLGTVGDLRVDGNTIEAVALATFEWTPEHVAAVAALAPAVSLAGAVSPRDVLDRLLAPGANPSRAALDAVLTWLEQATLRGGIALSLVDGALLAGNRIADVGTRAEPAAPVPDAHVRTAGVALAGGSEIVVRDSTVERVRGTLVRQPPVPLGPVVIRPPVLDLLRRFEVVAPSSVARVDLHGSVVAMRARLMEYAAADAAGRQRLGGQIYAALDAVTAALEEHGVAGRRLAEQLAGATDAMRDAQGKPAHTRAANISRAVLSDAAALTADVPDVASAWTLAATFDHALLGEPADVVEAATAVEAAAPSATVGLEDLNLQVEEKAAAVIAAAVDDRLRNALAATLGTLAEGRARAVALASAMPPGGPTVRDTTVLDGMVRLTLGELDRPAGEEIAAEALERAKQGADVLADTLDVAHRELAARLRADIGTAVAGGGRIADLDRLTATLREVETFAADPTTGERVHPADLAGQQARFSAELAIVTADRIQQQVSAVSLEVESDAGRSLRLLQRGAAQLVNLVSDAPDAVRRKASAAARAIQDAVTDVENREIHRAAARTALRELADEQARLAGVTLAAAEPAAPAPDDLGVERVAALATLLADLPEVADPDVRTESLAVVESQVRRASEGLDLAREERSSLLERTAAAAAALRRGEGDAAHEDAMASLVGVVDELAARTARAAEAPASALATRTLTAALSRAITPRVDERDRLVTLQRWVTASAGTLSPALVGTLTRVPTLAEALGAVRDGLTGLLPLPPRRPLPVPLPGRLEAEPADGVFAAGVGARLGLAQNSVRTVRSGAVVAPPQAHVLAPVGDGDGLHLSVERNRVVGAALRAIDLDVPGTSVVDLVENDVTGCAGLAEAAGPGATGAVVRVAGRGELVVDGNRFRRNGDPRRNLLLHELVLDWRGDVTVQDNVVRHVGAGSGGAGVLLITDDVAGDLVGRLAQEPALVVEPAVAVPPVRPGGGVLDLPDVIRAGLAEDLPALKPASTLGVGGFRIAVRDERPTIERLEVASTLLAAPAEFPAAAAVVAFEDLDRPVVHRRLLDALRRVPARLVLPFRPTRRAVHVVGNDVVAAGPALLVLCEGSNLVSATVVGNEFESTGIAGAVYLRGVDSTVFATNRCESLRAVTVVVLRGRRSVMTVTGNVVTGAQPPTPQPSPLPWVRPDLASIGDLTLSVAVGPEAAVTLPLDASAMLEAIDRPVSTTFAARAAESEVKFGQFAKRAEVTADPRVRQLLASGTAARFVSATFVGATRGGFQRLVLQPRLSPAGLAGEAGGLAAADVAAAPDAEPAVEPREAAAEPAVEPDAISLLVSTTNTILGAQDLDGAAKLFGLATTTGMTGQQAKAFVQAQLAATSGDDTAALSRGLASLTGIEDVTPVTTPKAAGPRLLEDVVGLALRSKLLGAGKAPIRIPRPPRPPAPDPRRHSLVVLGCARAGVVNNISTAGVHVHDAGQSVQNNL